MLIQFKFVILHRIIWSRYQMSIKTSSFMARIEIAYAVQSIAESHNDKAVQSGHWVGKIIQT